MNRGLITKAVRETWLGTGLFGIGLALVEGILAYVLPSYQEQISLLWSRLGIIQFLMQALVGAEAAGGLGPELLGAIPWVHPVVLALVCGHAIAYCTRIPTGEIDRGTIDVLLGLPISRWQLYANETCVWLVSGCIVITMGAAGNILGAQATPGHFLFDARRLGMIVINLFALYFAIGGVAWVFSALGNRRGWAIGAAFAFVLGSLLLNFLASSWNVANRFSFLSPLHYYRPLLILRGAIWSMRDLLVLFGSGVVLWIAGGIIFSRRDLSTL